MRKVSNESKPIVRGERTNLAEIESKECQAKKATQNEIRQRESTSLP